MENHRIKYDPNKNSCCGNCTSFENKDSEGWGYCKELQEPTACSEYCERWEEK